MLLVELQGGCGEGTDTKLAVCLSSVFVTPRREPILICTKVLDAILVAAIVFHITRISMKKL